MIDAPSHIEVTTSQFYKERENIKKLAIRAMRDLPGWCSQEKAEVMIDLIRLIHAKTIVEIGVFGGKSLIPMAVAVKDCEGAQVYGIDPWTVEASVDGLEGAHKDWWGQIDHEALLTDLESKIRSLDLQKQITLIRATSEEAYFSQDIDFLHIDGNHSDTSALFDVQKWVPLVRKGGLIFFDDLDWKYVSNAAEWLNTHCTPLCDFLGVDNEWGIWIKP